MSVESKSVLTQQMQDSAKRMAAVRTRKETERLIDNLGETEPKTPTPTDLVKRA